MWKICEKLRGYELYKRELKGFKEISIIFRKPVIYGFLIWEFFIGRFRYPRIRFEFQFGRIQKWEISSFFILFGLFRNKK